MPLNRRHFLFGALAAPVWAAKKKQTGVERPNIVLIVAQDLGAYMLGCYANAVVHTPNIDRLAQTGVRFTQSFSCWPGPFDTTPFAAGGYYCGQAATPQQTSDFLDQQGPSKTFFLTVTWPSPNAVTPTPKNRDLYAAANFDSIGWDSAAPNATHPDMLDDVPRNLRKYAAALTTLDDQVAALSAKLQQRGIWETTLVIFTSRGGYLLGRHGLWGDASASNPPNMYEEVVRSPLIWSWPARFPPQTVRNEVVSSYNLLPALAELAGLAGAGGKGTLTYLPLVYGRRLGKKQSWPNIAYGAVRNTEMARDDRYKLILRDQGNGPGELYDEVQDGREQTNQIDSPRYRDMRQKLTADLAAWRAQKPQVG